MRIEEKVAHIIPTHERPGVCQRLVDSIVRQWPNTNVYVCDDSERPAKYKGATNIKSPAYDIGLSAKRNVLIQESTEPYVFIWDDDYMATSETSLETFYHLLTEKEDVGIVGGEWTLGSGEREVWFTGTFWPDGPLQRHVPPKDNPSISKTPIGKVRYHNVMFTPNWFLAERSTLESIFWDEELKLQEHTEFFARLSAARAKRGDSVPHEEKDRKWLRRYEDRQLGNEEIQTNENGRVEVYTMGTFRNPNKLDHYGGIVHSGKWVWLDRDYAEELAKKGLVYTRKEMTLARPFPVPSVPKDVPLKVLLTPDTSCLHLRWKDTSRNDDYVDNRDRKDFWPYQRQKLGTEESDLGQWGRYPHEEIDYVKPKDVDLSLSQRFTYYDQDQS